MPYATRDDLAARFGSSELDALAPEAGGSSRADAALDDASAEIDGALHDLYPLPLPAGPWPALRAVACALARLRLFDDEAPKSVRAAALAARRQLGGLARGELALVDAAGVRAPRRALVEATAPAPAMSREALSDA